MTTSFKSTLYLFLWMVLLTGILYPLFITAIAKTVWSPHAEGSFAFVEGKPVGSSLIAQKFEDPRYFWPRPSANDYNALASGGSNLGPTSAALKKQVEERREHIAKAHEVRPESVPSELIFASGSGLDPHIRVSTATFQIDRIAKARHLATVEEKQKIQTLIDENSERAFFGLLGPTYVNVLTLNILLNQMDSKHE